jgi:hypothetical protein
MSGVANIRAKVLIVYSASPMYINLVYGLLILNLVYEHEVVVRI